MHELSLIDALFDRVDQATSVHPSRTVRMLRVRVGELAGVEPELFVAAFETLRGPRGYEASTLELVSEEASWRCSSCSAAVARGGVLCCETCGGEVALVSGGGIFLDRIELELRPTDGGDRGELEVPDV